MQPGQTVRIVFSSADAQTAAVLSLYGPDGAAVTLSGRSRLWVTNLLIAVTGALTVDLFTDANSDGTVDAAERMANVIGIAALTTCWAMNFTGEGSPGAPGLVPKVKASAAGQVTITGTGVVQNA